MSTFSITGFSRVFNYDTMQYEDYRASELQLVREDAQSDFLYAYSWIDQTGMSPKFANVVDPWSQHATVARTGGATLDLLDPLAYAERQVYSVTWAAGKTAYVFSIFQQEIGVEHCFFIGGDIPVINSLATLNNFLSKPQEYVLEGPFESGNAIPLADFVNATVSANDLVIAHDGQALRWNAGAGDDTLNGGGETDMLNGGAGNDIINGGPSGYDTIWGGAGDDHITSGGDFSLVLGGAGNDTLIGNAIFGEFLNSGSGNDVIYTTNGQNMGGMWIAHGHTSAGSGDDTVHGGLAGDMVDGDNGNDQIFGNDGDDWISGGNGADEVYGGSGNDMLDGNGQDDSIMGGTGDDVITGGSGLDSLYGEDGNDTINGGTHSDNIYGGDGNDVISGGDGGDRLYGDTGNDTIDGNDGQDQITGGVGHDLLRGGEGNDVLRSEGGRDTLEGGAGNDTLQGGAHHDLLDGGTGSDVFRFITLTDSLVTGMDTIVGFELGLDDIDLSPMDANPGQGGNQAFTFIGTAAFTAVGQVRVVISGTDSLIEVNTIGTSGADMAILVQDTIGLLVTDFLL